MEDLSLHILDIVENSVAAAAKNVEIIVREDSVHDLFTIEITDDGRGMNPETAQRVIDPFFTTRRTRRVGLGVPLLAQAAKAANGSCDLWSVPGVGTKLKATFQRSHTDRKPLGDLNATIMTLITGNRDVDFIFRYERDGDRLDLDTKEIKAELGQKDLNTPEGLAFIRNRLLAHTASHS